MRLHQHKSAKSGRTTMPRSLGWLLLGSLVLAVALASGGYYAGQRRVCAITSASVEDYLMEIDKMGQIPGGRLEETPLNPYFSDEFIRLYEAPCAHYGHAVRVLAWSSTQVCQTRASVAEFMPGDKQVRRPTELHASNSLPARLHNSLSIETIMIIISEVMRY